MPAAFSYRGLYTGLNAESSDRILNDVIEERAEQLATISICRKQSISVNCSNDFNKWMNSLFHHARIRLLSLQHIR